MSLLKSIFGKKDNPITSYDDFWDWFIRNEKTFFSAVKQQKNIEKDFFNKLSPKLNELKDGFFYLTGMCNDHTAELVITADGAVKNIVFVEEFIAAAPNIDGWKFTALKPAMDIKNVSIHMAGYQFDDKKLSFYANEQAAYPDEIDITVVHDDLTEENRSAVANGVYIFLDNYLGEMEFATGIDNLRIEKKAAAEKELVPIAKLKDFLIWREKEFIEKYEGTRHNTDNDNYSMLEAELQNGHPLLAVINRDLLNWDSKASHPWMLVVEMKYDGKSNSGMPDDETYKLLGKIEDEILNDLKDIDGYLNIGRETAEDTRETYIACKDFRKPSKVLNKIVNEYSKKVQIAYTIYKDKYWRSLDRFSGQ